MNITGLVYFSGQRPNFERLFFVCIKQSFKVTNNYLVMPVLTSNTFKQKKVLTPKIFKIMYHLFFLDSKLYVNNLF
jgi:hypothetical protein